MAAPAAAQELRAALKRAGSDAARDMDDEVVGELLALGSWVRPRSRQWGSGSARGLRVGTAARNSPRVAWNNATALRVMGTHPRLVKDDHGAHETHPLASPPLDGGPGGPRP
jgi:hypothetical protein